MTRTFATRPSSEAAPCQTLNSPIRNFRIAAGFSNGGTVAVGVARQFCGDRRLGGVVSVSGSLLPEDLLNAQAPLPVDAPPSTVLLTHGSRDPVRSFVFAHSEDIQR